MDELKKKEESKFIELFAKSRVIGVVGNRNTGKSSLVLSELIKLKQSENQELNKIPVYVLGSESNIEGNLNKKGINIIYSKDDILNLQIKNSIIFLDEFGDIFDTRAQSKEQDKIRKFFNRIAHNNCYVIISSAKQNFWNKFLCGIVQTYLVLSIDFDALVNGTVLKRIVKNLETNSEYYLDIQRGIYFCIYTSSKKLTQKCSFEYLEIVDSKKTNVNPFKEYLKDTTKGYLKGNCEQKEQKQEIHFCTETTINKRKKNKHNKKK